MEGCNVRILNRHEFNVIRTVHEAHEANTLHGGRNPPVLFPKVLDNSNYTHVKKINFGLYQSTWPSRLRKPTALGSSRL